MSDSPGRHVAYQQVKVMLDFMAQHVDFARGQLRSLEARHVSKRLWTELTQTLNSCPGTRKTTDGWSRYWSDFKNKLKNKVRIVNKRKRLGSTGAGERGSRPLTKLEKRALAILGPGFERKVSRLALQDYQGVTTATLPQVKTEAAEEPPEGRARARARARLRLSPERPSEDEAASELDDDEADPPEPLMSSLYPKWLIEIEQKRAEAELSRARASEARARAAAAQAAALRALAAAVARIASLLDSLPAPRLTDILAPP